ncbi:YdiU family protein [Hansschlegelia quercus]|uniref:Protein nucleotidyltransferase YdiU n=1 Tax=Hansschlegelia quercus TaxID=2528245 RepID=A0A4Q9GSM4_9HYPH|nr:YdiU family protein [Hansschlegelia quercus]TBN55200.1 YdiU family protein [Hansschlegelia quercus]
MTISIPFDNTYARLPEAFHRRTPPTPVGAPKLIALNRSLAAELGLDPEALSGAEAAQAFAGNAGFAGSEPIATAYAGHQFGQFVPQLGDGRAILLGEVVDAGGVRRDIQLKGAGPTPFSRRGDGRAALGPVLREYLISEAMAALGVPTTRALAATTTGEQIYRETALPGAVLTRVASSHIRVGTFQYFAARRDMPALKALVDHVVDRHYPEAAGRLDRALALLERVVSRQAALVAQWMHLGFVHGVMNTDNCSIAGETIDYGPCAFIDVYDPKAVFSSIDRHGRYALGNQPAITHWNLTRLAECLLPLLAEDENVAISQASEALDQFAPQFEAAYIGGYRLKLGLVTGRDEDFTLIQGLLDQMEAGKADYTLTFRRLGAFAEHAPDAGVRELFEDPSLFDGWGERYLGRLARDPEGEQGRRRRMDRANPAIIPRNHYVEAMIAAAVESDFAPFEAFAAALSSPYDREAEATIYAAPPPRATEPYRTFCGT